MPGLASFFDRYNLIQQFPIFQKLNWFDQQKIATRCRVVEYHKGEVICRRGEPADNLYCVISGRIQAYTKDKGGKLTNVEFIHRGMYFGIISLLTGEGHSLSFRAMNDSVVLLIAQEDFHEILKAIPQLGVMFSRSLSQRLRRRTTSVKNIFESHIISVYGPVKETGSSTYALNLAFSLQQETHKKIILVNIVGGSAEPGKRSGSLVKESRIWKQAPVPLAGMIENTDKMTAAIRSGAGIPIDRLNVFFDPADGRLRKQISPFVTSLVDDYHFIVVDLPNEMDDIVLETLTQSDMIHLVTFDSAEHVLLTSKVLHKLEDSLKENFHPEKIHVLISAQRESQSLGYEAINKKLDYDVYARLEYIKPSQWIKHLDAPDMSVRLPDPQSPYARVIRKIARQTGNVLVGLVLGGGAALGLAHIGVLKVFEEEQIPIDIIAGSSMGALIGGLWAVGYSADQITHIASEFGGHNSFFKLVDPIFPISGFIGGRAIRRWLNRKFDGATFYETRIPLKIVAYDLIRRQEMILDSGLIEDAILRSVAIPGVMRPIIEQDKVIIDGGVLNPLPTNVLTRLGVNKIISVNVLQSPADVTKGYLEKQYCLAEAMRMAFWKHPGQYLGLRIAKMMKKIFSPSISDIIVNSLQASEYVIAQQSASLADVRIHPDLADFNWFDLGRGKDLIQKGEEATRAELPVIRQVLGIEEGGQPSTRSGT